MNRRTRAGGRLDRWRRRRVMRIVAVFWTPVLLLFLLLYADSVRAYLWAGQFDDWWSRRQTFKRVMGLRILGAVQAIKAQSLEHDMNPEAPDASIVRLDVDRSAWDAHAASIEHGFDTYFKANVLDGSGFHPVRIRFRGDTSVHWLTEKRSFTLKMPRTRLWRGYRRLAFSSKAVLEQFLTSRLAGAFDLLAPDTWLSPVYLNDRFYGLYRVLERVDESFLRRRNRMPGTIYRGDTAERGEYFKHQPRSLFLNPYIWDRTAVNDRPTAPPPDALLDWVRDMNDTTITGHVRFMARVDRTEVAHLVALMLVTGDLFHMSGIHNQYWYEDPATALLHPIPWDIELRRLRSPPHRVNRFLRAVLRDPRVFDASLSILHAKLSDGRFLDRAVAMVQDAFERYRVYFEYDELRAGVVSRVATPQVILPPIADPAHPDRLRDNIALISKWSTDARARYAWGPAGDRAGGRDYILDIESAGYAGLDLVGVELGGGDSPDRAVSIIADRNRDGRVDDDDPALPLRRGRPRDGHSIEFERPVAILSGIDTRDPLIQPEPLLYRFVVRMAGASGGRITAMTPVLRNRITGATVEPEPVAPDERVAAVTSIHPWDIPRAPAGEIRLAGAVHLDGDLRIGRGQTLVIEPGTRVELDPDVSIVSFGRVIARGTDDAPIVLTAAVDRTPWGSVALIGRGADQSRFSHCTFEQGGGGLVDRIELKGMVSVHGARRVRFEACTFRDNLRCDDAINVVRADVSLDRGRFVGANADAIDYDLSAGTIRDCDIRDSGNDGIDLMSCNPRIIDNRISGSSDKGISIGEDASPVVLGNQIRGCGRGVEIKDGSAPLLAFNRIEQNDVGVMQAVKNPRYGAGGRGRLIGCVVSGNETDFEQDRDSAVTVARSRIGDRTLGTPDGEADDCQAVLATAGVACDAVSPGRCANRREITPWSEVFARRFRADFVDLTGGWSGWSDMRKEGDALVVRTRGFDVTVMMDLDLTLDDTGAAVWQFATRGIESVRLTVVGDQPVSRTVRGTDDLRSMRWAGLTLPVGRYHRIEVTLRGHSPDGRFDLRSVRILAPQPRRADRSVAVLN